MEEVGALMAGQLMSAVERLTASGWAAGVCMFRHCMHSRGMRAGQAASWPEGCTERHSNACCAHRTGR